MRRALLVLALLPALPSVAAARVQADAPPAPAPSLVARPTFVFARLASALELPVVPRGMLEDVVRWRMSLRDLVHGVTDRLAQLAARAGFQLPDLTVLVSQPLVTSDTAWPTSGFGWRDDPMRHHRKWHSGADIRAESGTPVLAAGDGVIVFTGRRGGYGNVIDVSHGGGVITRYAHLRRIEARKDAIVTAGQRIGQVGRTGRATGPHLHFEVRLDGRAVDPGTAMTVGELQRDDAEAGRLAAFALSPEVQALEESELDPPKTRKGRGAGPRPERVGRTKRSRPTS